VIAASEGRHVNEPGTAQPSKARKALTSYPARIVYAVGIVAVLVLAYKAGVASMPSGHAVQAPRPAQAASVPATIPGQIGDGTWLVGIDIQPGTYRSTGAVPRINFCWWGRLSDTTGDSHAIIASGAANAGEQIVVTINPNDRAFKATNCEPFVKVSS
jgi:predicted peptidase